MTLNPGCQKELIILTEHFAPSTGATAQLVTDLADDLHQSGVSLRVLTSTSGSTRNAYPVLRFSSSELPAVGILNKARQGLTFFMGSALWLFANIRKNQSLLIVSNPPFIGLIGVLLSIVKSTRYVFLFQDIFPRSASLTGILPAQGPLILFWRVLLNEVLSRSQATIVLSSDMMRRCRLEFGPNIRLEYIHNWAVFSPHSTTKHQSPLAKKWGVDNIFTVQYSGNFGRLHEILIILEAARLLQGRPIKFLFVGGGAKSCQIHQYRDAFNLTNILIRPYQPRNLLTESLAACDLSIVSLIPGAEDTVAPSKLYGILASSRPVLLVASKDCELASLVCKYKCGVVVPHGDPVLLSNVLASLSEKPDQVAQMATKSLDLYQKKYGRSMSVSTYRSLLHQLEMI